jgi:PIN domain nuclease of toxin-antitoxin system
MHDDVLLLDTHVWIWGWEGNNALGVRTRTRIDEAARDGRVRISVMSVWELAMLVAKNRLVLAMGMDLWVERALAAPGVRLAGFSTAIALESNRLPGVMHADPTDRILAATARVSNALLVTADRRLLSYATGGHVGVLDAAT